MQSLKHAALRSLEEIVQVQEEIEVVWLKEEIVELDCQDQTPPSRGVGTVVATTQGAADSVQNSSSTCSSMGGGRSPQTTKEHMRSTCVRKASSV